MRLFNKYRKRIEAKIKSLENAKFVLEADRDMINCSLSPREYVHTVVKIGDVEEKLKLLKELL